MKLNKQLKQLDDAYDFYLFQYAPGDKYVAKLKLLRVRKKFGLILESTYIPKTNKCTDEILQQFGYL